MALLFILWAVVAVGKKEQKFGITTQVEKWRTQFHLNEAQVTRLKEIEFEYHGDGNPFGNFRTHSKEEIVAHRAQIRQLLGIQSKTGNSSKELKQLDCDLNVSAPKESVAGTHFEQ